MPSEPLDLTVRPATVEDLEAIAAVHVRAREAAVPQMPPGVHPPEEVRAWVGGWDLERHEVWVAESAGEVVGYVRLTAAWLDDLYVDPDHQGAGVGSTLLEVARSVRPDGFCLWVFESNTPAREFYTRRGLVGLEHTDGSANEERSPDLRMAWPGHDPVRFLRGLVDEVDGELGDLLARRAALTRAIQHHKDDTARDPEREREIAAAMARRAPALGEERLSRIVHVVITESLDAAREA
jgi:GNAT superfamily N-acetyltransferase/chorismate mutase